MVASEKGVVVGRLTFREDGDAIDCGKMGVGGKAIPPNIDKVQAQQATGCAGRRAAAAPSRGLAEATQARRATCVGAGQCPPSATPSRSAHRAAALALAWRALQLDSIAPDVPPALPYR